MRNALAHVSKGQHTVVVAAIRQAFEQPDRIHAAETWHRVADQVRPRWPKLADLMDASEHDVLAYMAFPRQHRTKLHSTDVIDKTFLRFFATLFLCSRPRGEAWRVGWKRHRAACSVPAGLRRLHTHLLSEGAAAKR